MQSTVEVGGGTVSNRCHSRHGNGHDEVAVLLLRHGQTARFSIFPDLQKIFDWEAACRRTVSLTVYGSPLDGRSALCSRRQTSSRHQFRRTREVCDVPVCLSSQRLNYGALSFYSHCRPSLPFDSRGVDGLSTAYAAWCGALARWVHGVLELDFHLSRAHVLLFSSIQSA